MNINNVKVGDKFSTESKLLTKVGFEKYNGKPQKEYQIRELQRYLSYEKTGKISRGKPTNEIIITEIFNIPKEKIDNRKNNGGNNTSIIADYIHDTLCYKLQEEFAVCGSKSSIVRQMDFFCEDFSKVYYNFDEQGYRLIIDGERVPYSSNHKEFFLDFCDEMMVSLRNRLKRILDNLENITIKTHYQLAIPDVNKDGEDIMTTEDIEDEDKNNNIKEKYSDLEVLYGVIESKDKWKIYGDKIKRNKFHNQFVSEIQTLLKREDFVNCYEVLEITPNDNFDPEYKLTSYYKDQLDDAILKLVNDKIQKVLNKTKPMWDSNGFEYVKVNKYNMNDITDELLNDCKDMINLKFDSVDENTGGISHGDDEPEEMPHIYNEVFERLSAPAAEYHSMAM